MRIIFLGTPDFAVASLAALIENQFNVVAVVTAPDKPSGRGQGVQQSAVKQFAVEKNLPVLQPEKLKNPAFLEELKSYQADLQIIVAFRMLPEVVWNMPRLGTFNLHASLLPQYRGAAPIHWAIINGETQTGVSTFFLQHEIDTGPLIFQETEPIYPEDTLGTLYPRMMARGASLVVKTAQAIEGGEYPQIPQPEALSLKTAPKISRETGQLFWQNSCENLHNLVRGLSPNPGAWFVFNGSVYKVFETKVKLTVSDDEVGSFRSDQKTFLKFRASDGWVALLQLQAEGKKRLTIKEFLLGNKL